VDNAWEQKKLEASLPWRAVQGKILENGGESHTSTARFVGRFLLCQLLSLWK